MIQFLLILHFLVFVEVVRVFLEGLSQLSLVLRPSHSVRILQLWWTLAELLLQWETNVTQCLMCEQQQKIAALIFCIQDSEL